MTWGYKPNKKEELKTQLKFCPDGQRTIENFLLDNYNLPDSVTLREFHVSTEYDRGYGNMIIRVNYVARFEFVFSLVPNGYRDLSSLNHMYDILHEKFHVIESEQYFTQTTVVFNGRINLTQAQNESLIQLRFVEV